MNRMTVWKVGMKRGERSPAWSFSIKRGPGHYPIIFTEEQFLALFPDVNTSLIPEAPMTTTMIITGEIK